MRMVVTMWATWHAKRKVIYEKVFQSPFSTRSFVERYMADLALSEARFSAQLASIFAFLIRQMAFVILIR